MTEAMWACIDAFPWATTARAEWPQLTTAERARVVAAAKAEERASQAYVSADKAIERARARIAHDEQPTAKVRFT